MEEAEARVRYLRACDRCRRRKMRCDSANPCEKCASAGLTCTFDQQPTKVSKLAGATSNAEAGPSSGTAGSKSGNEPSKKRRRSLEVTSPDLRERRYLDPQENSHFFVTQDGLARFAGSTSGLPLLDAARRQLQQSDLANQQDQDEVEPNWSFLSSLLGSAGTSASPISQREGLGQEDVEYFPGHDMAPGANEQDVGKTIAATIPADLFANLIRIYFDVIHPAWPILYPCSFSTDIASYKSASSGAIAVAMCMLASRYITDTRVQADSSTPASAGVHYFPLFRQLRDLAMSRDNVLDAVQALLLAGMFHCVDNTPHAVAQALFAEAAARCLDGGLHRNISSLAVYDSIEKQTRSRTAWACYIWDKQLAAICGRGPLLVVWDFDVSLPAKYERVDDTSTTPRTNANGGEGYMQLDEIEDEKHCRIFVQHALVTAILERTLAACMHRPVVDNSELLNRISASSRPALSDDEALNQVYSFLDEWRRNLPADFADRTTEGRAQSPLYGVAYEQLAGTETLVELLLAARKLQLATALPELHSPKPRPGHYTLHQPRAKVLSAAKDMVNLAVHLGSAGLLGRGDIMLAFRILVAGRMILAVVLSARSDGDRPQQDEAESAAQAVSILLRHISAVLPISLGSAEVFDETCRVCRVRIRNTSSGRAHPYAWYRPLGHKNSRQIGNTNAGNVGHRGNILQGNSNKASFSSDGGPSLFDLGVGGIMGSQDLDIALQPNFFDTTATATATTTTTTNAGQGMGSNNMQHEQDTTDADFDLLANFSLVNPSFEAGHMALPFMNPDGSGGGGLDDFSWLLPGGNIPYYVPDAGGS